MYLSERTFFAFQKYTETCFGARLLFITYSPSSPLASSARPQRRETLEMRLGSKSVLHRLSPALKINICQETYRLVGKYGRGITLNCGNPPCYYCNQGKGKNYSLRNRWAVGGGGGGLYWKRLLPRPPARLQSQACYTYDTEKGKTMGKEGKLLLKQNKTTAKKRGPLMGRYSSNADVVYNQLFVYLPKWCMVRRLLHRFLESPVLEPISAY